jgi:hypothetical protein
MSSCGSPIEPPAQNLPPSSQRKMIEKYEKFYGEISVDSSTIFSLFSAFFQQFSMLVCFLENLLNFLFNIFLHHIIVSLLSLFAVVVSVG